MERILFFSERIHFKLSNPDKTAKWLLRVCKTEKRSVDSVTYVFCSDTHLVKMNRKYLRHSTLTDILSFDYSESERLHGDIYISIPRVKENAKTYNQPFERELRRVLVHGLLHFIGYNDKEPSQKAQMRIKEEACLSLWK